MAAQPQEAQEFSSRNRVLIPAIVVLALVVLVGAISNIRGHRSTPIFVAKPVRDNIVSAISTNGKIEPVTSFEAHAPAPASVRKLFVKAGEKVAAGQLLVQLDDSDARAEAARALAQVKAAQADLQAVENGGTHEEVLTTQSELTRAQAELQAAQRNLESLQSLQKMGAASPAEVQDGQQRVKNAQNQVALLQQKKSGRFSPAERQRVEAQLHQAQAAYAAAEDVLAKSDIRSTVAGTVYNLPVKAGSYVNAGDLIVQVADLSQVSVRAFVDEPDLGKLAKGQTVNVTWDALPGRVWQGTVTQVPTTVEVRGSRNVGEVPCTVNNDDRRLLPNVNVSVIIVTAEDKNALTVPREAVHEENGQRYVLQVAGDRLKRANVQTGIANLTRIQITSGISDGTMLALQSANGQPIGDGTSIRVQQ